MTKTKFASFVLSF